MPTGTKRRKERYMAIEASKFTEKDELISKFYTLRAGLSVIAEETSKIREGEYELRELILQNEKTSKEFQEESSRLIAKKKYLEEKMPFWEKRKYFYEEEIRYFQKLIDSLNNSRLPLSKCIKPALLSVIPVFIFAVIFVGGPFLGKVFEIGAAIAIAFTIIGSSIIGYLWGKDAHKREKKEEEDRLQYRIKENQAKFDEFARMLVEAKKEYKDILERYEKINSSVGSKLGTYEENVENYRTKLNTEIIPVSTSLVQSIQSAMIKTSNGVITEADWANIDLLIFYLETGRADSLKEALQLVDKQRQTDQITYAIHEAGNYIVNTLGHRLNQLGSIIYTGFNNIAFQIQSNHDEVINNIQTSFSKLNNTISAENRDLREILKNEGERIANAEYLNASLLQKANESSDELMRELRYNQRYWYK